MRVLQLIKTAEGATWALRQVRELVALGHEIHVVLPGDGPMRSRYLDAGASVHMLDCDIGTIRSPFALISRIKQFRGLVHLINPDLVHSHFVGTTMFMRLALRNNKTPRVFQVPGLLHLENRITRRAELMTAQALDYWVASCKLTRSIYLEEGVQSDRVGLAYYGTDFTRDASRSKGALRAELGIPSDARIVGMVAFAYAPKRWLGYSRGIKGHEDLIDALAILNGDGKAVHGVFVGGSWAGSDEYYRSVIEYGKTCLGERGHFMGTRGDVHTIYPDFDLAVHPSHSENLGGALESLALAIPTITTDIGGFPDIVIEGQTGWRVPAKDPAALAQAISKVLDLPDHGEAIAAKGRALVLETLDARVTSAQMDRIYKAIGDGQALPC